MSDIDILKVHYVYRITNIVIQKHYYGCRTCIGEPLNDIGVNYYSSSKDKKFIIDQKENPNNYKYKILQRFKTRKDAIEFEIRLHNKFDVGVNESFYNRAKQSSNKFDTTGTQGVGNNGVKNGMFGKTHSKKTRKQISDKLKSLKLSPWCKGKTNIFSKETLDSISKSVSEQRWVNDGKTHIKIHYTELDDYLNEGWVHGMIKKSSQLECPHCGKIGSHFNIKRWHFDNCKHKEIKC